MKPTTTTVETIAHLHRAMTNGFVLIVLAIGLCSLFLLLGIAALTRSR